MNKSIQVLLVVALLVGIASTMFLLPKLFPSVMPNQTESMMEQTSNMVVESAGGYREFSPSILAANSGIRRVLFFYANWCPTCIPADADIRANADQIPTNLAIIRVNYNDTDTDMQEKALAQQYGITYQHTFVQIDELGQVVTTWNGGDLETILSQVQ